MNSMLGGPHSKRATIRRIVLKVLYEAGIDEYITIDEMVGRGWYTRGRDHPRGILREGTPEYRRRAFYMRRYTEVGVALRYLRGENLAHSIKSSRSRFLRWHITRKGREYYSDHFSPE